MVPSPHLLPNPTPGPPATSRSVPGIYSGQSRQRGSSAWGEGCAAAQRPLVDLGELEAGTRRAASALWRSIVATMYASREGAVASIRRRIRKQRLAWCCIPDAGVDFKGSTTGLRGPQSGAAGGTRGSATPAVDKIYSWIESRCLRACT